MVTRSCVVPTVVGREDWLARFFAHRSPALDLWPVTVVANGYSPEAAERLRQATGAKVLLPPEPLGPFKARWFGTMASPADAYLWVDDDIYCLPETEYETTLSRALHPGMGWTTIESGRSPGQARASRESMARKHPSGWYFRPCSATSGGAVFSHETWLDMSREPPQDYLIDDWQYSLRAYLAGRENWHFCGTCAVHTVTGAVKPGFKNWARREKRVQPDERYMLCKTDPRKQFGEVNPIWGTGKFTPRAHAEHAAARAARGWV